MYILGCALLEWFYHSSDDVDAATADAVALAASVDQLDYTTECCGSGLYCFRPLEFVNVRLSFDTSASWDLLISDVTGS